MITKSHQTQDFMDPFNKTLVLVKDQQSVE